MKWPWKVPEADAQAEAETAREEYIQTLRHRAEVEALARELRHQRTKNGWTEAIINVFGGHA